MSANFTFSAYNGSQKIDHIYKGSKQIESVYKGNSLVWIDSQINPGKRIWNEAGVGSQLVVPMDCIVLLKGQEHGSGDPGFRIDRGEVRWMNFLCGSLGIDGSITICIRVEKGDIITTLGYGGVDRFNGYFIGDKECIVKLNNNTITPAHYDNGSWSPRTRNSSWWYGQISGFKVYSKDGIEIATI